MTALRVSQAQYAKMFALGSHAPAVGRRPKRITLRTIAQAVNSRAIVDRVELTLPVPPSTNALTRNVAGRGRVKTKAYLRWLKDARWAIQTARVGRIEGRYKITISVGHDCPIDLDNFKAVQDLLATHGIIDNDRLAQKFLVDRTGNNGSVHVLVRRA